MSQKILSPASSNKVDSLAPTSTFDVHLLAHTPAMSTSIISAPSTVQEPDLPPALHQLSIAETLICELRARLAIRDGTDGYWARKHDRSGLRGLAGALEADLGSLTYVNVRPATGSSKPERSRRTDRPCFLPFPLCLYRNFSGYFGTSRALLLARVRPSSASWQITYYSLHIANAHSQLKGDYFDDLEALLGDVRRVWDYLSLSEDYSIGEDDDNPLSFIFGNPYEDEADLHLRLRKDQVGSGKLLESLDEFREDGRFQLSLITH
jgi:hypothetical protein